MKNLEAFAKKWAKVFMKMDEDVREETVTAVIPEQELSKAYADLRSAQNIDILRDYAEIKYAEQPADWRLEWAMIDLLDAATSEISGDEEAVRSFMENVKKVVQLASHR